jgi:TolB protein
MTSPGLLLSYPFIKISFLNIVKKIKYVPFILGCFLLFFFNSCNDNPVNNGGGPCPAIVSSPAYNSPVWHPGGEFIGFNHTPLRKITFPYEGCPHLGRNEFDYDSTGFWLINSDGTNMRRIFPYTLQNPAWSPDGEWIAFSAPSGSEHHIFKMKFTGETFDTTTLVQLTSEGRNFFPTWSPDGEWIAFDSNINSPNGMHFIWKMKTDDGSQKIRIAYEPTIGEIRQPNWSPDGKQLVHHRYIGIGTPEIFTMNILGTNIVRLTYDDNFDSYSEYSPDGLTIAYASDRTSFAYIFIMDSNGTNRRQLIDDGADRAFTWSPDGNNIVYTKFRYDEWSYENGVLWIINIITGGKRQLTFNIPSNN